MNFELENKEIEIDMETNQEIGFGVPKVEVVGGNNDYNKLVNKPKIEGVELKDDKTFGELGITSLTNSELENLLI